MNQAEYEIYRQETAAAAAERNQRMRDLFNTPLGKKVLVDIIEACEIHIADAPDYDHGKLAFRAGQRMIALWIMTCLDDGPEGVAERLRIQRAQQEIQ